MDNKQFTPSAEQFVYATAVIKYYLHSPFPKLSDNWLTEDIHIMTQLSMYSVLKEDSTHIQVQLRH